MYSAYKLNKHGDNIPPWRTPWALDTFILKSWRRQWHLTPVLLPRKSHGRRSLVGCSPWGSEESDTTEQLHFAFSLSCIGEGNGNPLQYSCLENPRNGGAWWAPMGSHRVGHNWSDLAAAAAAYLSPRPCLKLYMTFCIMKWRLLFILLRKPSELPTY